ncbi:MAG TPA: DoxX family protein [bacterium]|nr:DoxX family protein [bacterium]
MRKMVYAVAAQHDLGLALLRIVMGIIVLKSGYNKLFTGIAPFVDMFTKWGIWWPQVSAPFIGLLEFVGGILLIVGLFTRYLGALFVCEFIVATWVHWVVQSGGMFGSRLELLLLFGGVLFATNGGGAFTLDRLLKRWDA